MMNLKKKIAPVLMGGALAVATAVPVFAADASTGTGLSSVETALTTSFTSIGSSMTSVVGKILPIALPIMGALLLVGFGIKAFKKVANKA
jgi:Flp pilus assembly pilin Flp